MSDEIEDDEYGFVRRKNYAHHSIHDLRKRFRVDAITDPETAKQILQDICRIHLWGVSKNKVLVWNGQARALITVKEDNVARVEFFNDQGIEEGVFYVAFSVTKDKLKCIRELLLANMELQVEYEMLYYGNHVDYPLNEVFYPTHEE